MPRRRPGRVRAGLPGRQRTQNVESANIDGLSRRTLSEIVRLERTRNYLHPGDVGRALRLWREFVRLPERRQWHEYEYGNTHWDCCGDPLKSRALLDSVLLALSPSGARELRGVIGELDALACFP